MSSSAWDGRAALPPGPAVRRPARRRRPTGAPPPLPHPVSVSTTAWLIAVVVVLAGAIVVSVRAPSLRLDDRANAALLRFFARARTPWLTGMANGIVAAGSGWGATVVGLSAVAATMAFRRWRHLLVFLCSLFVLEIALLLVNKGVTRPRPASPPDPPSPRSSPTAWPPTGSPSYPAGPAGSTCSGASTYNPAWIRRAAWRLEVR